MALLVNGNGSAIQKEEELSGFIFMCSGVTKPQCYLNRVFGLPAARREVVEKIKPGTKLFLFDFDAKLLYGVYEATSKGGVNLQPSAFGGRFPAQVQFKICNDCIPLPMSSFRTAIKDNYQGSKFTPELNAQQVRDLLLLFKPIVAPSTASPHPAVAYSAPETQMLALAPNTALRPWMQPQALYGVSGPRMPPPASNGRINPSLIRYSQNRYRPYQVGPLHNRSLRITQPQLILKNELNPHLHRPHPYTPHQAPPAPVNPYQFPENRPTYLSNELYSRYLTTPVVDPHDQRVGLDGGYSGQVIQPVYNHVDGYPQGHNAYTPKPSYVSPQGPHLSTQPPYSAPIYTQLQSVPAKGPEVVGSSMPVSNS
uniref:uncharacterized protein LOC122606586 n=1 Tax=Erigeron canadensis TaxID=72917 RepID=UPI001CB9C2DD|nr:uncharacterized protein LOC122606586 [Erigeron canadensis]